MSDSQQRVLADHSWSRIPHDCDDRLPYRWFVAVHRAFRARWLLIGKWAPVNLVPCVLKQFAALEAHTVARLVLFPAVKGYHCLHGSLLAGNSSHMALTSMSTSFSRWILPCPTGYSKDTRLCVAVSSRDTAHNLPDIWWCHSCTASGGSYAIMEMPNDWFRIDQSSILGRIMFRK